MGNTIHVPFVGFIDGGLKEGMDIVIQGTMGDENEGFSINLCTEKDWEDGDTAFHFNPRPEHEVVVRNCLQGGDWGEEETVGGFPFKADQFFSFRLKVKDDKFKVTVDSLKFCDFDHRMPIDDIRYLTIKGDVKISMIHFKYPLPYSTPTGESLREGSKIYITGKTKDDFERFSVNLRQAPAEDEGDTIFHFNPRYDEECVVRNHNQGDWGFEQRNGEMPFHRDRMFRMEIHVEDFGYRVFVDGDHFCDFDHRMPIEDTQFVTVDGDIEVNEVRVEV